jgi:hypothetical protein
MRFLGLWVNWLLADWPEQRYSLTLLGMSNENARRGNLRL